MPWDQYNEHPVFESVMSVGWDLFFKNVNLSHVQMDNSLDRIFILGDHNIKIIWILQY